MPRRPVDWMTNADIFVLEFLEHLAENDAWANPATLAFNLGYANSYMSERCSELKDRGMVERSEEKAFYRITEKGREYLRGDIGPEELAEE